MGALEEYLKENAKEFRFQINKKIKEKNSFVLDVANPRKRQYVSYPVHRLTFLKAFATEFNFRDEKSSTGEAYELVCAKRVCEIFSIPTVFTWNKTFDWALLLPQFVSTHSLCGLSRGDIVLPINVFYKNGVADIVNVFAPAGPNDEKFEKISLQALFNVSDEKVLVKYLPEKYEEGFPITTKKGDNYFSLKSGSPLEVGDYIVVRGSSYKIKLITDDDAFTSKYGQNNIVCIWGTFANNVNRQKLRYKRVPRFAGSLHTAPYKNLLKHKVLETKFLLNKNGNKHGTMEITFYNTVFNSAGVMIQ